MPDEKDIVEYRLKLVEEKLADTLSSINSKLENIASQQNNIVLQYALINQAVTSSNGQIKELDSKFGKLEGEHKGELTSLRNEIVAMKISQAERMGWGALGGGAIAAVLELFKWFMGR